jgi:hypothetical protein
MGTPAVYDDASGGAYACILYWMNYTLFWFIKLRQGSAVLGLHIKMAA